MREVVNNLTEFAMRAGASNANFGRLAREGLDAMIDALVIVAQAGIRVTQGILGLRQAWLEMKESALDYLDIFRPGGHDETIIEGQIAAIQETVGNLEVLHGSIGALGDSPGPRQLGERFEDVGNMIERAVDRAKDLTDDPLPPSSSVESVIVVIDKYAAAIKDADAAMAVHVATVQDGMRELFTQYNLGQEEIRRSEEALLADKSFDQLMQMKVDSMADASARIAEESKNLEGQFSQLGKLGEDALGGLVSGLQGLSMAALWKKDGDALKDFGKSLGKMLIQLGTMAIAYAAVAALGAVFPALQPLVGSPAGAPALLAAGAGALAAGAVLGAAIPRGGKGAAPSGGGGGDTRTVETSQTTVYNLTLGAGMSQRGMSRSLLEQVSTAAAQGV
jgi:hypothetical protein